MRPAPSFHLPRDQRIQVAHHFPESDVGHLGQIDNLLLQTFQHEAPVAPIPVDRALDLVAALAEGGAVFGLAHTRSISSSVSCARQLPVLLPSWSPLPRQLNLCKFS